MEGRGRQASGVSDSGRAGCESFREVSRACELAAIGLRICSR
jgi:hypothetical protein